MTTKIIAVDGPGGAGKSHLVESLSKELGDVPIVRTDDFASWDNPLNWWPRLVEQVLKPLSRNKAARYQRYDWDSERLAEWHDIEPAEFLLIEESQLREKHSARTWHSVFGSRPRELSVCDAV